MSFVLSKFLWAFSGPNAVLIALLLLGQILSYSRRPKVGRAIMSVAVLAFLAVTFLPLDDWLLAPLENRFPRPQDFPPQVDGILVLGGAINPVISNERGIPSLNDASERLTSFIALARSYPGARLIFTGGSLLPDPTQPGEAEATRKLLSDLGLDPARVSFEGKSRNTFENAEFSKALAQPQPGQTWLLVTSASHMPRTVGVFRRCGWPVVPWPVSYKSSHEYTANLAEHLRHLEWAIHEWIGLFAYRLGGRSDAWFPAP